MGQNHSQPVNLALEHELDSPPSYQSLATSYRPLSLDISNLPDISPYPRRMQLETAAEKSRADGAVVRQKSTKARTSTRKRKSQILGKKPPPVARKLTPVSSKAEGSMKHKFASSPRHDDASEPSDSVGSGALSSSRPTSSATVRRITTSPTVLQAVSVPRIDVIESSPLLTQASQQASILMVTPTTPTFKDISTSSVSKPDASHGNPGLIATSHVGEKVIGRRSSLGFAGLPLPGTAAVEEISFEQAILRGLEIEESGAMNSSAPPPVRIVTMERSESHASCASSHVSAESVVTQEIRILRVVNPDSVIPSATSSGDEGKETRLELSAPHVSATPPISLAVKRNVASLPAPIKVLFPHVNIVHPARLSPITPTSASSSRLSGSSGSGKTPSSAATSLPPSPTPRIRKNALAQAALGVSSSRPPVLPDPFEGMDAFAAAFGITSHSTSSQPKSLAAMASPRRQSGQMLTSAKAHRHENRHASYHSGGNRTRSASHSSSDGDRSAAYSSTSALTGSSRKVGTEAAHKGKLKKKQRNGHRRASKDVAPPLSAVGLSKTTPARYAPKDIRQVSAPPALISLDFGKRSTSDSLNAGAFLAAPEPFAPPRSPRPPNTPVLGFYGADNKAERLLLSFEGDGEMNMCPSGEVPAQFRAVQRDIISSPLLLPDIQQSKSIDWDMTDFLLRCGIPPSPTNTLHGRDTGAQEQQQDAHPPALRPRVSLADVHQPGTPAPWLGSHIGNAISPSPMRRHTVLELQSAASPSPIRATPMVIDRPMRLPVSPASVVASARHSHRHDHDLGNLPSPHKSTPTPRACLRGGRDGSVPITRYAAFQLLAQQAVDEPYNPFLDSNGAVRLGEYKRGQNEREILRWLKGINKVKREGRMLSRNEK